MTASAPASARKKYSILIAEDTKAYSNILKTKFIAENFDVVVVENGKLLFPALEVHVPNIIILDLLMPEQDGFETLRLLKLHDKFKKIKVIVLTNLSQEEDKQKCMDLGAEEVFIKSNTPLHEIVDKIKTHLK